MSCRMGKLIIPPPDGLKVIKVYNSDVQEICNNRKISIKQLRETLKNMFGIRVILTKGFKNEDRLCFGVSINDVLQLYDKQKNQRIVKHMLLIGSFTFVNHYV